jgi:sugar/nucleoside kinase (ribokinase family)
MEALFIGHSYIDVTVQTGGMPSGDEKAVAEDYAVSFGGNAVTAAFACAKLGHRPDLITTCADDWLGRMFIEMAARYRVALHTREVRRSSLSFILPHEGKRAILRARDEVFLSDFPRLDLRGCRVLHLDGHQADAAIYYARECRARGILTSLDGGGVRTNTGELLE